MCVYFNTCCAACAQGGVCTFQVQDKFPERWLDEAAEQRASGEWSNAGREEADVIIVGEVRSPP